MSYYTTKRGHRGSIFRSGGSSVGNSFSTLPSSNDVSATGTGTGTGTGCSKRKASVSGRPDSGEIRQQILNDLADARVYADSNSSSTGSKGFPSMLVEGPSEYYFGIIDMLQV